MTTGLKIALAACAAAVMATAAQAQEDPVQALADRWTEAYNTQDVEALGGLYADDAHLYLHGLPSYRGREAIQDFWAEDMQVGNPLTVLTVTDRVEGVDMILVHGNYQVIDRDNGVPLGEGRFAHIWELGEGGEWALDRDLWVQPGGPQ